MRDLVTEMKMAEYSILGCSDVKKRTKGAIYPDKTIYCDICGGPQLKKEWKMYQMCSVCYHKARKVKSI